MSWNIRLASPHDLSEIQACAVSAYERYIPLIGKTPAPMQADFAAQIGAGTVWVAVRGPSLLGFIVFYSADCSTMMLENVAVLPSVAGQGIGRGLIEHCEAQARLRRSGQICLYTNAAMVENLSIYPHLGYREVGRKSQDGFKRVFFVKELV